MGLTLYRDSLSHMEIADHADFDLNVQWSVCLDVRVEAQPATNEVYTLVCKGGLDATTTANFYVAYRDSSGTKQLHAGFIDSLGNTRELTRAGELTSGRWYTVLVAYSKVSAELSIYAVPRATYDSQTSPTDADYDSYTTLTDFGSNVEPATNSQPVRIGVGVTAGGLLQNGANVTISELSIWRGHAFTAVYVPPLRYRLTGQETLEEPFIFGGFLRGYWRLDDGAGRPHATTATDRHAGSGHDATLRGGATWADDPADRVYSFSSDHVTVTAQQATGTYDLIESGMWWGSGGLVPGSTIAASEAASGYPVTNVRSPRQALTWRSSNVTGTKTLTWNFGRPWPVSALIIAGCNLESSGQITAVMATTSGGLATPAVSQALTYDPRYWLMIWPRPQMYQHAQLQMVASGAETYIEVGAVHWFAHHEFLGHADFGSWGLDDASTAVETPHRDRVGRDLTVTQGHSLSLPQMMRGQGQELRRVVRTVGDAGPVLVIPDVRRAPYGGGVYGRLSSLPSFAPAEMSWTLEDVGGMTVEADRP